MAYKLKQKDKEIMKILTIFLFGIILFSSGVSALITREINFSGTINENWTQEIVFDKPSNMSIDCSDIRWLDSSKTIELGHRNLVCNSSSVIEHIKLNSNNTIYLIYGVANISTSKWKEAYQCGDDFEDNVLVNIANVSGSVNIANGKLNLTAGGNEYTYGLFYCANQINSQNYTFFSNSMLRTSDLRLVFRSESAEAQSYQYQWDSHGSVPNPFYYMQPTAVEIGDRTGDFNPMGVWNNHTIIVNGSNYILIRNGVQIRDVTDSNLLFDKSFVGFGEGDPWEENIISVDWFYVMPFQSEMPTYQIGEEVISSNIIIIPVTPITTSGQDIYNILVSSGAGLGIVFSLLGIALPILLFGLMMVALIVAVAYAIFHSIKLWKDVSS